MTLLNDPLFSIIVPVYNTEAFLVRCLDSILDQTYGNFELLAIDDGSTDNSGQILDEYAHRDDRIRVFHQENGGLSAARNKGLDNAEGRYICFVDSDDYMDVRQLERVKGYLDDDDCEHLSFGSQTTGLDGQIIYDSPEEWSYSIDSEEDLYRFLMDHVLPGKMRREVWSQIFNRSLLGDLRFVDNRIVYAEDFCFTLSYLSKVKRTRKINDILYYYERHDDSLSVIKRNTVDIERMVLCAGEIYRYYREHSFEYIIERFQLIYFLIIFLEVNKARRLMKEGYTLKELRSIYRRINDPLYCRMTEDLSLLRRDLIRWIYPRTALRALNMLELMKGRTYIVYLFYELILNTTGPLKDLMRKS